MNKLVKFFFGKTILREAKKISNVEKLDRIKKAEEEWKKTPIDCKMRTIDCSDNISVPQALGISEEKHTKLAKQLHETIQENKSISEVMCSMSMKCCHPNELGYVNYLIGMYKGGQNGGMDLAKLAFLSQLLGGKGFPQFGPNPEDGGGDES